MASTDVFRVVFVDYMPSLIDEGVLYVSMLNHTAIHLCACGCGEKVVTPIAPNRWFLTYDGETISLNPSIGNWSFVCKSHYFIQNNRVLWCEKFRGRKRHRQNNLIKNVSLKHAQKKMKQEKKRKLICSHLNIFGETFHTKNCLGEYTNLMLRLIILLLYLKIILSM